MSWTKSEIDAILRFHTEAADMASCNFWRNGVDITGCVPCRRCGKCADHAKDIEEWSELFDWVAEETRGALQ